MGRHSRNEMPRFRPEMPPFQPRRGEIREPRATPGVWHPTQTSSPERAPQTATHPLTRPFRASFVLSPPVSRGAAPGYAISPRWGSRSPSPTCDATGARSGCVTPFYLTRPPRFSNRPAPAPQWGAIPATKCRGSGPKYRHSSPEGAKLESPGQRPGMASNTKIEP